MERLSLLSTLRNFSIDEIQRIDSEIVNALIRAQGPITLEKL
jgi:hypothetical protein